MDFDRAFAFCKVVATSLGSASKMVLANVRAFSDGDADDEKAETSNDEPLYGQLGIVSRPLPAGATGHAEVIAARTSDGLLPLAGRDLRVTKARGNVAVGSHNLCGYGGAFTDIEPAATGTGDKWITYVPYQHPDGQGAGVGAKAHAIVIDTTTGNESITIAHAGGCAVFMNADDELVLRNVDGSQTVVLKAGEININGVIKLFGGIVAGNSGTAEPVMLSVALLAWVAQVNAALGVLATHVHGGVTAGAASTAPAAGVTVPAAVPLASATLKASLV